MAKSVICMKESFREYIDNRIFDELQSLTMTSVEYKKIEKEEVNVYFEEIKSHLIKSNQKNLIETLENLKISFGSREAVSYRIMYLQGMKDTIQLRKILGL